MIPLAVPNLTGNERKYLNECIDSTFVSSVGSFVTQLEEMVADKTGSKSAVATSAGTTALHLSLMIAGVKPGDLVVVPSFTFIASANAIAHCGATPWFMDITESNWTIDPEQIRREFEAQLMKQGSCWVHKATGRRVSAIMPVYTVGNVADMDAINEIACEYDIPVLADAACALGARYKGRDMGELALMSSVSFNGNKTVTCGGGGAVFGNDIELIGRVKHISSTARVWPEYDFDEVGYNYRMTNLQAAVGCAQLERLDGFIAAKRNIRAFYDNAFGGITNIELFPCEDWCDSACWFSGVVVSDGDAQRLHEIEHSLKEKGIESRSFWKPVHLQRPYLDAPRAQSMAITERLWDKILTLPCSTGITQEELDIVAERVIDNLKG